MHLVHVCEPDHFSVRGSHTSSASGQPAVEHYRRCSAAAASAAAAAAASHGCEVGMVDQFLHNKDSLTGCLYIASQRQQHAGANLLHEIYFPCENPRLDHSRPRWCRQRGWKIPAPRLDSSLARVYSDVHFSQFALSNNFFELRTCHAHAITFDARLVADYTAAAATFHRYGFRNCADHGPVQPADPQHWPQGEHQQPPRPDAECLRLHRARSEEHSRRGSR